MRLSSFFVYHMFRQITSYVIPFGEVWGGAPL